MIFGETWLVKIGNNPELIQVEIGSIADFVHLQEHWISLITYKTSLWGTKKIYKYYSLGDVKGVVKLKAMRDIC